MARRQLLDPSGIPMPLTSGEFNILAIFCQNPQKVLSRDSRPTMNIPTVGAPSINGSPASHRHRPVAALCEHLGLRVVLTPTHAWNTLISE